MNVFFFRDFWYVLFYWCVVFVCVVYCDVCLDGVGFDFCCEIRFGDFECEVYCVVVGGLGGDEGVCDVFCV